MRFAAAASQPPPCPALPLPAAPPSCRVAEELVLLRGGAVGYYSGDPRGVAADAQALRPTLFMGVPRVFERLVTEVGGDGRGRVVMGEGG